MRHLWLNRIAWLIGACAAMVQPALALDQIRTTRASAALSGALQSVGAEEVTFKRTGQVNAEKIPLNEILWIRFDGEPPDLHLARTDVNGGGFENCLNRLARIQPDDLKKPEFQEEVEFYRTLATARLAISGTGDLAAAEQMVQGFGTTHPESFHRLAVDELWGDVLVAQGKYSEAATRYARLEEAPWIDVKLRGAISRGRALVAQQKYDEALTAFDVALAQATASDDPQVKSQGLSATLGKAAALAELNRGDEGIQLVNQVIAVAEAEDKLLHARAYNCLGTCLRKQGKNEEALYAFLHVDVLWSNNPPEHAEALYHLSQLWLNVSKPDRAAEAAQLLKERYANSPWAKL